MNKLNAEEIKMNTHWSEHYAKRMMERINKYQMDEHKDRRLEELECKTCFYLKGGLSGQAFTQYNCKNCGTENHHPNTSVPKYCEKCAKEHQACVRCGASL